ncbi:hypothetical protein MNB_SV-6-21 [hydrothermal vent metagenome]|uniref:ABC-type transport auxiliary lipoprotein component domain-containing protein n=1 Tax=hydrothermal vent metagenome TaxID=652676 RepID=A0A1W1BHW3_9ZZZZ
MTIRAKIASLFVVAMAISGCSIKGKPMVTYTISPNIKISKISKSPYRNSSIKISYPTNIKGKSSSSIYYSYSDMEEGVYQNASWGSSSSQLLTYSIIRALEQGGVFKSAIDYRSVANVDYTLESEVYEFYHKVRKDISLSVVSIRFDLIDSSTNELVKSKKFTYEISTDTTDAKGYVKATNRAIERLSRDLVKWLARR